MGYLARRALHAAFLLFGVSLLVFLLVTIAPGDFYSELRLNPSISPQAIEELRARYGLDRPVYERYRLWVAGMMRGDWGISLAYQVPVWPLLRERMRNTLLITLSATGLAWVLALAFGMVAASQRGRVVDLLIQMLSSVLLSIPDLLICLVLLVFAVHTRIFPVGGMTTVDAGSRNSLEHGLELLRHMALPVIALTLSALPVLLRHVQSSMASALAMPSVRTAEALGLSDLYSSSRFWLATYMS